MGIELQSAPPGHHKVGGAHGQTNKPGDASQSDGALGFAALMSLMSCQESESTGAQDATDAPLLPLGSDGTLAGSDGNAALVPLQPADGVLLALPSGTQAPVTGTSQFDGQGMKPVGSRASAPVTTQPGIDLAAGVSGGRPASFPPGLAQPRSGFASPADTLPTPLVLDPKSEMVSLPVGTDAAPVPLPGVVPVVQGEAQAQGIQLDTTGKATAGGLVSPAAARQGLLVPPQGGLKPVADLPASHISAVQMGSQVPTLVPLPPEQATAKAPRLAADQSKSRTDAKQVLDSLALNGQAPTPMPTQTSFPTLAEPQGPTAVLKPAWVLNLQQVALAGQAHQDANDLATGMSGRVGFGTTALPVPAFVLTPQDAGIRLSDRPAKHLSNRFGSGSDGVYGQPITTTNPADVLFQVPSTSAAAACTVVAETVSYWASQGVQNASLQLDGFGDEPVEVRISVNGDMAQVDFRTNQPEVRLAIEGAASQLKDMLSSQGMQLTGLSIGTSGRGGSQDKNPRAPSDARKLTLVKPEAVEAARVRPTNPSVGQSLDLFV